MREVDSTTRGIWLAECGCLALVAAGAVAELARARLLSHRIAGIVVGALPSAEALRAALATSAGDANLSVVYPQGDGSAVDDEGRHVGPAEPGSVVTDVMRGREKLAQLRHAGHLRHAPDRLADAARAAWPALEHGSSRATLRARLRELTASRTRIVEVGDAERRRLERNLHDGAQQRLIALSVALQRSAGNGAGVVRAREEILAALDELRALAHGIHPASLTDAGLEAALRELADGCRVPVRLELTTTERLPAPTEAAAYRVVLDGVRCAERRGDGRAVVVVLSSAPDALCIRLMLPGVATAAAASLAGARVRPGRGAGRQEQHRARGRRRDNRREAAVRIVIAEDMALMRAGLARLLADRGFELVGEAEDAEALLRLVERVRPDAAIVDIKMPPTHTDEGLRAATADPRALSGHLCPAALELSRRTLRRRTVRELSGRHRLPAQGARGRRGRARGCAAASPPR